MRPLLILSFLLLFSKLAFSQSIAASNFNYWYNPLNDVELQIRPVRAANKVIVRYTLVARNGNPEKYSITWEARNSFVEHEGLPINLKNSVLSCTANNIPPFHKKNGAPNLSFFTNQFLKSRVAANSCRRKRDFIFFRKTLPPHEDFRIAW